MSKATLRLIAIILVAFLQFPMFLSCDGDVDVGDNIISNSFLKNDRDDGPKNYDAKLKIKSANANEYLRLTCNFYGVLGSAVSNGIPMFRGRDDAYITDLSNYLKKGDNLIKFKIKDKQTSLRSEDAYLEIFVTSGQGRDREVEKVKMNVQMKNKDEKEFALKINVKDAPNHIWDSVSKLKKVSRNDKKKIYSLYEKFCEAHKRRDLESVLELSEPSLQEDSNIKMQDYKTLRNKAAEGIQKAFKQSLTVECAGRENIRHKKYRKAVLLFRRDHKNSKHGLIYGINENKSNREGGKIIYSFNFTELLFFKKEGNWFFIPR